MINHSGFTNAIETYRDLMRLLNELSQDMLDQPIQILPPNPDHDHPVRLRPVHCLATVGDLDRPTRSAFDDTHRIDHVVLCVDVSPFDEDGSIAEDLCTGEKIFPRVDLAELYDAKRAELAEARRLIL